jgi:FkbM family methyltransferase
VVVTLTRRYLNSRLRGRTRLPIMAARYCSALQAVPIIVESCAPFYVDLRTPGAAQWFAGSPWNRCPQELVERDLMRRLVQPGDTVYDIGANIGLHTVLLRGLTAAGRVIAFEANPERQPCLSRTLAGINGLGIYVALADRSGSVDFFVPEDHSMASLADWTGLATRRLSCECRRLDDLDVPAPDFIKCDVEGADALVFRGARKMLDDRDAPVILFESNARAAARLGLPPDADLEALRSCHAAGYTFYAITDDGRVVPHGTSPGWRMLAIPRARRQRLIVREFLGERMNRGTSSRWTSE